MRSWASTGRDNHRTIGRIDLVNRRSSVMIDNLLSFSVFFFTNKTVMSLERSNEKRGRS